MLKELMEQFCEETEGCSFYGDYSGRCMFGRRCSGIVIERGYSYIEVMMDFTRFLSDHDFEDCDCELLNPAVDELGLETTIVYFPSMKQEAD